MTRVRILLHSLLLTPSVNLLLGQPSDTTAHMQQPPGPAVHVTPSPVFPAMEERLLVLLTGLVLIGGLAILLNKKRRKADLKAFKEGNTK